MAPEGRGEENSDGTLVVVCGFAGGWRAFSAVSGCTDYNGDLPALGRHQFHFGDCHGGRMVPEGPREEMVG